MGNDRWYPTITLSHFDAALAYDYENRDRIDSAIAAGRKLFEEMKAMAGPSRLRELLEWNSTNPSK